MTRPLPECPQALPVTPGARTPVLLGLDCSSTSIGWAILDDGQIRDAGTLRLTGSDIAERCRQARAQIGLLLLNHPDVDAVAIESPVCRFAKALIPQARVSGAVLGLLAEKQIAWVEVTPSEAKRALTSRGDASKADMMTAAGLDDEHAADACGVARAALKYVRVTR